MIWGVGVGVYLLAVFHRTSLGVAGPQAAERLDLSAGQLSTFVMLQLGVYAAMQVPTGILVDRFGPRRMLLVATVIMGSAQLLFSQVESYPLALLARGLLGCGDAMTYISVLRLVAGWFPARRYPVMVDADQRRRHGRQRRRHGAADHHAGRPGLGSDLRHRRRAVAGLRAAAAPAGRAPRRTGRRRAATGPMGGRRVLQEVKHAWRLPAGRLGFWIHLSTMAGPTVFAVLWGYPYLTQGLGYAPGFASSLLLLLVIGGLCGNLILGPVLVAVGRRFAAGSRWSWPRCACSGWLTLILWPGGQPPVWVVVVIVCVFSVGGPASGIGFMLARDYNPRHRISTATGLVNVGGFCGAVVMVFAVGQILDFVEPGAATHSLGAYRWALAGDRRC